MNRDSVFKIKQVVFLDTLIQIRFFKITKTVNFRGDLSEVSARKESLMRYDE